MEEKTINYSDLFNIIKNELIERINSNVCYSNNNFFFSMEQFFIKKEELDPDGIYIVIKFSPATINFGQTVLPLTIEALSEGNHLDICKELLCDFSQKYNLCKDKKKITQQLYNTPVVVNNFISTAENFRSLINLTGAFVITPNIKYFDVFYYKDGVSYDLPIISTQFAINSAPDTQPFYENDNFTETEIQYASISISFSMYFYNCNVVNDIVEIIKKRKSVNETFMLQIVFDGEDKEECEPQKFKLVNSLIKSDVGEIPMISFTFIN